MGLPDIVFTIVEDENCPLYENTDSFKLSNHALALPLGKAACMILVLDITETLLPFEDGRSSPEGSPLGDFQCSGCTGKIRLQFDKDRKKSLVDEITEKGKNVESISGLLKNFSFFQTLSEEHISELVPLLKIRKYQKGDEILTKGDAGKFLFILLNGTVEVLGRDDVHMAFLKKGEVFGEMSLLSGDPIGATVRVVEPSTVLHIESRDFRKVLTRFPSLQMYFARLLAKRLARSNVERYEDFSSGMSGHLSDMSPAELFQALNVNQKTGVVKLNLSDREAEVVFRDGELIGAQSGKNAGKEAFYEILQEKEGRFKFVGELTPEQENAEELGNFMWLLMEGARHQDEAEAPEGLTL